jgi:hypothetical protein
VSAVDGGTQASNVSQWMGTPVHYEQTARRQPPPVFKLTHMYADVASIMNSAPPREERCSACARR